MGDANVIKPIVRADAAQKGSEAGAGGPGAASVLQRRISKNAYVFDVHKKYSLARNFALKKKPETPMENIRENLQEVLAKKKPPEGGAKPSAIPRKTGRQSPLSNVLLTAIAVILLFIIGGAAFVIMAMGAPLGEDDGEGVAPAFMGKLSYSLQPPMMVSAEGERGTTARRGVFLINYAQENLSSLNFTIRLTPQKPITQVFLLNYPREGADSYPAFRQALFRLLPKNGIGISEIGIDELPLVPAGAAVIAPTGYLPSMLLGADGKFDLAWLLSRGVDIVYIGFEFDKIALDPRGGTVPAAGWRPVVFSRGAGSSNDGFRLFDPQYSASQAPASPLSFAPPIYGSVSVAKLGEGSMLFLPQTLDGGWRGDGEAAAEDIARLVVEGRWRRYHAETTISAPKLRSGTVTLLTGPVNVESAYVELAASASDRNWAVRRTIVVDSVGKAQRGEMLPHKPVGLPTYVSGQKERFNIELREPRSDPVKLFVRFYQDGRVVSDEELELGLTNPTTDKPKDVTVNVPPGTYVVQVEDGAGKIYAATLFDVGPPEISKPHVRDNLDWKSGRLTFRMQSPIAQPNPRSLTITMDGGNARSFTQSSFQRERDGSVNVTFDIAGGAPAPGKHVFVFDFGPWSTEFESEYRLQKQMWDDPLVVGLGLLSVAVFAVGYFYRQKETPRYGLDIPDFPPLTTIKIPMKRETVLDIFDSVNAAFSWKWMPLRSDELKNGFRRLTYNGKPILIGDFNLERILSKLKDEGVVKECVGYFGLSRWEKESGRTVLYLAIYRVMRNIFVNNAVKFTKLGAVPDCDVKALVGKDEVYFHIMEDPFGKRRGQPGVAEPDGVVHRALASAKKGTVIIVFATDEERDAFVDSLVSTSKLAVGLKMEMNNGKILLLPVKNAISGYLRGIAR